MLKLSTSFSKKVPVPGQEFSSQSYHAAVELELSDALKPEEVQTRIHQTFDMVRRAVETEINGKAAPAATQPAAPAASSAFKPVEKASNKQVKFILDLASGQKLPLSQLNADVQKQFGVADIYALDRKQASALVDSLKQRKAA
ncbi:MAG: hypothetical protein NTY53_14330 [Kiritimatiellaeota bacterium]|nr:hypothetical protein [Kiritimatiellota bacterium]